MSSVANEAAEAEEREIRLHPLCGESLLEWASYMLMCAWVNLYLLFLCVCVPRGFL